MASTDASSPTPRPPRTRSGRAARPGAEGAVPRRVVVLGATGNVGTALLARLAGGGHEVVGVARRLPDRTTAPYDAVRWHPADMAGEYALEALTSIFEGADAVVHLAWRLQGPPRVTGPWNVLGTRTVLRAAAAAGVRHVVVNSSVAAYSPGPRTFRVDEDWPTGGVHTSRYSREKAQVERLLDAFERAHPEIVTSRIRPGFVLQRSAAREQRLLFAGPLVPPGLFGALGSAPVLPLPDGIGVQTVHADDLADALVRVLELRAGGAFDIAAEPVLDADALAAVLGARRLRVPYGVARSAVGAAFGLRLTPSEPGWLDLAALLPHMSTARARSVLGWHPSATSDAALAEAIAGLADDARHPGSPALGG